MNISIIIPVLNEATAIDHVLKRIRLQPGNPEVIVVDGGSIDNTLALSKAAADKVLSAPRGRANQMNAGAAVASHEVLLFLHADTFLPDEATSMVMQGLASGIYNWGRFDVDIDGQPRMLRLVALLMNWRSRLTGIATGDQAIFITKREFCSVGGFPAQPLMEDIELSSRLKRRSAPLCLRARVSTSGRRWETGGVWRTIFLMWVLRLRYWLGAPAERLAKAYR
jgi:rSAM/selenodomain-associated transferase 2